MQFNCPNCGAPLKLTDEQQKNNILNYGNVSYLMTFGLESYISCQYCKSVVVNSKKVLTVDRNDVKINATVGANAKNVAIGVNIHQTG